MNIMDNTTPEGQILNGAWNTVISKPGGPQRVYWGLESVDPLKVWCFFDFDSVEQHRQFAEEYGADAVKDIPKICTYGEFSKHIKMVPSSDVLGSPLTEVILAYFPQDISDQKKETLSSEVQEILKQAFPDDARVAHAWGVENDFPARSEDGLPRSVLMSFVGLSHSETWGDHQETNALRLAASIWRGFERTQLNLHLYHGMTENVTTPTDVLDQEHNAPRKPPSLGQVDFDRGRPACFSNLSSELGFIFTAVGSIAISETWPASVINLTTAVLILPFARLSDIHGGRFIFLSGHAWLVVWSIIAGLRPSAFLPSNVAIMSRIYRPGPRNTLVFSIFGASSYVGFYSGIFFGSLCALVLGWKWYFFISAFFYTGIFITSLWTIPKSVGDPRPDLQMDWLGAVIVVPGLALVVYALTDGRNAPHGYIALVSGIICLALFVYIEGWRASQPLITAELFRTTYMSRLVVALLVSYGSFSLVLFYASFYGMSNSFLSWAFVFPTMILAMVGVDITFNIHNFIITTSQPNHLQAVSGAQIASLLCLDMAFWLGVVEMATSAQKGVKSTESPDVTQCQVGFWTGTGLALIIITVNLQLAKAVLTTDDKA
ncbi:multidrug resistance [Fusarium mundagurra]|uniref:Multidrug resistance n=1 Tax=Fusarium mundagurra TaxID=1567541 RepID=A0A8H5Z846_9HYPO|nr:multidrug resistance [Fusarium mundagurra]